MSLFVPASLKRALEDLSKREMRTLNAQCELILKGRLQELGLEH